jgi:ribosome-associated protein
VQAIAEGVRDHLASLGVQPLAIEGLERGQWVLIDFGDVVVHVFQVPIRTFYDLDRLWARAPRVDLPEPFQSQARSQKTGTENV